MQQTRVSIENLENQISQLADKVIRLASQSFEMLSSQPEMHQIEPTCTFTVRSPGDEIAIDTSLKVEEGADITNSSKADISPPQVTSIPSISPQFNLTLSLSRLEEPNTEFKERSCGKPLGR